MRSTNRTNFTCELHEEIAIRKYLVYLIQWEMSYGLEFFPDEVRTAELMVIPHVPLMLYILLMPSIWEAMLCVRHH
jgi:hypothetical protein